MKRQPTARRLSRLVRTVVGASAILVALPAGVAFGQDAPIARTAWTLHAVDSEETTGGDYGAVHAFDGNSATMWSTAWVDGAPAPPHDLQVDLGASYRVSGFHLLPRQDGVDYGRIGQYDFSVSADGITWGAAVAAGTFANIASEQQVAFAATTGRFVRLRALSEVNGQPWTTVAELNVLGTAAGTPGNEAPYITLTDAGTGGQYVAPVAIALHATASDVDGTVSQVDFFSNSVLLQSDTSATYDFQLTDVQPGTYPFVAVAHDNSGNVTVSNTITITVQDGRALASVLFTPSSEHDTLVESYRMDIFAAGADPTSASPVASQELGKPTVVNGDCTADVQALMAGLQPGTYIGTVTAVAAAETAQSDSSAQFTANSPSVPALLGTSAPVNTCGGVPGSGRRPNGPCY